MNKIVEVNVGGVVIEFANYTPHDVVVYKMDGKTPVVTIPKNRDFHPRRRDGEAHLRGGYPLRPHL